MLSSSTACARDWSRSMDFSILATFVWDQGALWPVRVLGQLERSLTVA